jgi:hypothetical protein
MLFIVDVCLFKVLFEARFLFVATENRISLTHIFLCVKCYNVI